MSPIVILFTGHVGSSWISDMLGRQQWCIQLGFEPLDEALLHESPIDISHALQALTAAPSQLEVNQVLRHYFRPRKSYVPEITHFCFKTRFHKELPSVFREWIPKHASSVIHLRRWNKLKSAISNYKREALGISHLTVDESADLKRRPVAVDCRQIVRKTEQFLWRDAILLLYTRYLGPEVVTLEYEDMLRDPNVTLTHLSEGLRVPQIEYSSAYDKMTSDDIREAVKNIDELQEWVDAFGLEAFMYSGRETIDPVVRIVDLQRVTQPAYYRNAIAVARLFGDRQYANRVRRKAVTGIVKRYLSHFRAGIKLHPTLRKL